MTEAEWQASAEPEKMVRFLLGQAGGPWERVIDWFGRRGSEETPDLKPSPRKLRLFACACCVPLLDVLRDPRSQAAIEVSERFADDRAGNQELRVARVNALEAVNRLQPAAAELVGIASAMGTFTSQATSQVWHWAAKAAAAVTIPDAGEAAQATQAAVEHAAIAWGGEWGTHGEDIKQIAAVLGAARRASLLRELFGNPFRPAALDGLMLTSTVRQLAQGIYEERAFDRLPILGDALEENGCTDVSVLNHCREPGDHTRGCWVVDAVLGTE